MWRWQKRLTLLGDERGVDVKLHALIQTELLDARTAIKGTLHTPDVDSVGAAQQPADVALLNISILLNSFKFHGQS